MAIPSTTGQTSFGSTYGSPVTLPTVTGLTTGNILVVQIYTEWATQMPTSSSTSGWTKAFDYSGNGMGTSVWWMPITGSDSPLTISFGLANYFVYMQWEIADASYTDPLNGYTGTTDTISGTTTIASAYTTTKDDCLAIAGFMHGINGTGSVGTANIGWNSTNGNIGTNNMARQSLWSFKDMATAGSTGTNTANFYSTSNSTGLAYIMGINPADKRRIFIS